MKKIYLFILFLFLAKVSFGQTIEVIVSDTIMCEVENYEYLLKVNFIGLAKYDKRQAFEKDLKINNYNFERFINEALAAGQDHNLGRYKIKFKTEEERFRFELKMKTEFQNYVLTLMNVEIAYDEKEKIRLIEKLMKKGEGKADVIAKGLGVKLLKVISVSELYESRKMPKISDNLLSGNYNVSNKVVSNESNEGEKRKALVITFETEE